MSTAPIITIFVRHTENCKYAGDEFTKRCDCKKHLRWTANGKQYRRAAGTRTWAEAEDVKRDLGDQLLGRATPETTGVRTIREALDLFIQQQRIQENARGTIGRYICELTRLREYCEGRGVFVLPGLSREVLLGYCGTWDRYKSTQTRAAVRRRLKTFLRFCFESQWLVRIPMLPKITIDEPETEPLTVEEYARLLESVYAVHPDPVKCQRVHALLQLMRWSGLALQDAVTLRRDALTQTGAIYRVTTARIKTGAPINIPIPVAVAVELLTLPSARPEYFFWARNGSSQSAAVEWCHYLDPVFGAAGLDVGHMKSHRLRDTFATDLLEKGVPMEEVSRALGHTSILTTQKHYAKWNKGRQDRLDSLITGTWATAARKQPRKRAARVAA